MAQISFQVARLRDRVRSSDFRTELGGEPLLLHVKRGQWKWFGHLVRLPPERLSLEIYQARPDWEVAEGYTLNLPEGLRIPSGLGMPQDPPGDARLGTGISGTPC